MPDNSGEPLRNPQIDETFTRSASGGYIRRRTVLN